MQIHIESPYNRGFNEYKKGLNKDQNPYDEHTLDADDWEYGWNDAHQNK